MLFAAPGRLLGYRDRQPRFSAAVTAPGRNRLKVGDNRAVSLDERFEQLIAFLGSQLPAPVDQEQADEGLAILEKAIAAAIC